MNTKLIAALIIGIVAVVSVVVIVFGTDVFAEPFWKTETAFGEWQEGITIGYKDGTTQELKLVQDNEGSWSPLTVKYNGQEISWIEYYISAAVTDFSGFDSIKVDPGGMGLNWYLLLYPVGQGPPQTIDSGVVAGGGVKTITTTLPVRLISYKLYSTTIEDKAIGDGTYTISYAPNGNCQYWGYPGGDKEYVALPSARTVDVEVSSVGMQIVITLSGHVGSAG